MMFNNQCHTEASNCTHWWGLRSLLGRPAQLLTSVKRGLRRTGCRKLESYTKSSAQNVMAATIASVVLPSETVVGGWILDLQSPGQIRKALYHVFGYSKALPPHFPDTELLTYLSANFFGINNPISRSACHRNTIGAPKRSLTPLLLPLWDSLP